MVSPEMLRRYPFFAGVDSDGLAQLARSGHEVAAAAGEYLFQEGDTLDKIYLVVDGEVALVTTLPSTGSEVVISTVGVGDVFAWSGLVPPHEATSAARTVSDCRMIALDGPELLARFEQDHTLGYLMMLRLAQVMRDRIHDMHMEMIACLAE